MQTFGAITQATECGLSDAVWQLPAGVAQRVLSYLPVAHCYDRAMICRGLVEGKTQFFFTESRATFLQDIQRARPTMFCSVPRLWLKFHQSVLATVPAAQLNALRTPKPPRR